MQSFADGYFTTSARLLNFVESPTTRAAAEVAVYAVRIILYIQNRQGTASGYELYIHEAKKHA